MKLFEKGKQASLNGFKESKIHSNGFKGSVILYARSKGYKTEFKLKGTKIFTGYKKSRPKPETDSDRVSRLRND